MLHVFSLFPGIMFLSPFAATLLRIAAAWMFIYIATWQLREHRKIESVRNVPLVGSIAPWMVWVSSTAIAAVGAAIFVGLYTQAFALVGIFISLKHALGARWYPSIMPFPLAAYMLLFVICVCLVITGAGALAIDLPL